MNKVDAEDTHDGAVLQRDPECSARPRLELLGPVRVVGAQQARLGPRPLAVLVSLALRSPQVVTADQLLADVWGEDASASARNTLQVHVSAIRAALGPQVVQTLPGGYRTSPDALPTDAQDLARLVTLAEHCPDPERAADHLERGLALVRGAPLSNLADRPFAADAARTLAEQIHEAKVAACQAQLRAGRHTKVVPLLAALVNEHPLHEQLRALYATALYRSGRQADALATLRDLRARLDDELGVEPGPGLRHLELAVLRQDPTLQHEPPPPPPPAAPADGPDRPADSATGADGTSPEPAPRRLSAVPLETSGALGREQESAAVLALLRESENRMLTLLGPGGIGKTRLAQVVARRFHEDVKRSLAAEAGKVPVHWVSLEAVQDPDLLLAAVAAASGARLSPSAEPLHVLSEHLAGALLVLDNMEQLAGAAGTVADLLSATADLTVLTTSRQALHVPGEIAYPLEGLTAGPHGTAVQLFVLRAQQAGARLPDAADSRAEIAELVRRLDGLPLAIELAAARCRTLTVRQLLDRLDRLGDVAGTEPNRPARQRSLTATLTWSWQLLPAAQQDLLARMSVFRGTCPLPAIAALLTGRQSDRSDTPAPAVENGQRLPGVEDEPEGPDDEVLDQALELLSGLVDASLVQLDPHHPGRFTLLETVRAYAAHQLSPSARRDADLTHAAWYLQRTAELKRRLVAGEPGAVDDVAADVNDLRAVLEHEYRRGALGNVVEVLRNTSHFWWSATDLREYRGWLERLTVDAVGGPQGMELARIAGWTYLNLGDVTTASRWAQDGLRLCERARPDADWAGRGKVTLLSLSGTCLTMTGDLDAAEAAQRDALAAAVARGNAGEQREVINALAWTADLQGRYEQSAALYTAELKLLDELGIGSLRPNALLSLALAHLELGNLEAAELTAEQGRSAADAQGWPQEQAVACLTLGLLHLTRREFDQATAEVTRGLTLAGELGDPFLQARLSLVRGTALLGAGQPDGLSDVLRGLEQEARELTTLPVPRAVRDLLERSRPALTDAERRRLDAQLPPTTDGRAARGLAMEATAASRGVVADAP